MSKVENPTKLKEFDVFTRTNKGGWTFNCSVKAASEAHARAIVLETSADIKRHQVAVYLKR